MKRFVGRAAAYVQRFSVASENLGILSAMKLFAVFLFRINRKDVVVHAAGINKDIHFRGAADKGVLSHYFVPNYHIVDTPSEPVRLIVDAGANIGDETLRFRHFHPHATIVALEPESGNFRLLARNVEGDRDTVAMPKALWSHEGVLKLAVGHSNENFSVVEADGEIGDTEAIGIDGILSMPAIRDRGLTEIDILKLDIEGGEYEVFSRNYESWIRRVKVIIVECPDIEHPGSTAAIFHAISNLDFNVHVCGENMVMIRRDIPWKLQVSPYLG